MKDELNRKRSLGVPVLLALLLGSAQAYGQGPANNGPDRMEGVWDAKVELLVCANKQPFREFNAMGLFGRGGAFHDTNATDPKLRSATLGTWDRLDRNRYRLAFKTFRFDAAGTNLGWTIVRHTIVLADDGDHYVSEGTAEFYDSSGNLFMGGCSRSTATRFQ